MISCFISVRQDLPSNLLTSQRGRSGRGHRGHHAHCHDSLEPVAVSGDAVTSSIGDQVLPEDCIDDFAVSFHIMYQIRFFYLNSVGSTPAVLMFINFIIVNFVVFSHF